MKRSLVFCDGLSRHSIYRGHKSNLPLTVTRKEETIVCAPHAICVEFTSIYLHYLVSVCKLTAITPAESCRPPGRRRRVAREGFLGVITAIVPMSKYSGMGRIVKGRE